MYFIGFVKLENS